MEGQIHSVSLSEEQRQRIRDSILKRVKDLPAKKERKDKPVYKVLQKKNWKINDPTSLPPRKISSYLKQLYWLKRKAENTIRNLIEENKSTPENIQKYKRARFDYRTLEWTIAMIEKIYGAEME